jgi:hypothetical protein
MSPPIIIEEDTDLAYFLSLKIRYNLILKCKKEKPCNMTPPRAHMFEFPSFIVHRTKVDLRNRGRQITLGSFGFLLRASV